MHKRGIPLPRGRLKSGEHLLSPPLPAGETWWALYGSRGPAIYRWTCNGSKKQTFVFLSRRWQLSPPHNEYFRLVRATQCCHCRKEVAADNVRVNECLWLRSDATLLTKSSGRLAGHKVFTLFEALRIGGCVFLHRDLAIQTPACSYMTLLV